LTETRAGLFYTAPAGTVISVVKWVCLAVSAGAGCGLQWVGHDWDRGEIRLLGEELRKAVQVWTEPRQAMQLD